MSHSFFLIPWQGRGTSPSFRFLSILLFVQPDSKVHNFARSIIIIIIIIIIIRSRRLAEIRWSVCMSKSHWSLCFSFSRTYAMLSIYHMFIWSNFSFSHNSQWITLPTQSCLVLYSFCVNLMHSLSTWLMVSSLSPHNLHLLFCCVLSILALIWLVLVALFCAAIRRDSVSLLWFPFYKLRLCFLAWDVAY